MPETVTRGQSPESTRSFPLETATGSPPQSPPVGTGGAVEASGVPASPGVAGVAGAAGAVGRTVVTGRASSVAIGTQPVSAKPKVKVTAAAVRVRLRADMSPR